MIRDFHFYSRSIDFFCVHCEQLKNSCDQWAKFQVTWHQFQETQLANGTIIDRPWYLLWLQSSLLLLLLSEKISAWIEQIRGIRLANLVHSSIHSITYIVYTTRSNGIYGTYTSTYTQTKQANFQLEKVINMNVWMYRGQEIMAEQAPAFPRSARSSLGFVVAFVYHEQTRRKKNCACSRLSNGELFSMKISGTQRIWGGFIFSRGSCGLIWLVFEFWAFLAFVKDLWILLNSIFISFGCRCPIYAEWTKANWIYTPKHAYFSIDEGS